MKINKTRKQKHVQNLDAKNMETLAKMYHTRDPKSRKDKKINNLQFYPKKDPQSGNGGATSRPGPGDGPRDRWAQYINRYIYIHIYMSIQIMSEIYNWQLSRKANLHLETSFVLSA